MITAILVAIISGYFTMLFASLYVHRSMTHRSCEFHPVFVHFIRFYLWLTDGLIIPEWVAQHRKHHRLSDTELDPHSPLHLGIVGVAWKSLWKSIWHRYRYYDTPEEFKYYSKGVPQDWIECNIYTRHHHLGLFVLLIIDVMFLGWWGLLTWAIQYMWMPFWGGTMLTGYGHWWGYRNYDTRDNSRNLSPVGIFIAGDELHNNHHSDPANPKMSRRWFEFDSGWMFLKIFEFFKLVKIRKEE